MDFSVPISPCRSFALQEYLTESAEFGFSHISLNEDSPHCSYRERTGRLQLLSEAKSAGVGFDMLHLPVNRNYDITCKDAETRMAAVVKIALLMSAARDLGCRCVILTITHSLPSRFGSDVRSVIHALDGLVETAEIMGIHLAVRNLVEPRSLRTLDTVLAEYSSPYFGLCYDPALDYLAEGENCDLLRRHCRRLSAVVLSDTDGRSRTGLPPFAGAVDWHLVTSILGTEQVTFPLLINVDDRGLSGPNSYFQVTADARTRLNELFELS